MLKDFNIRCLDPWAVTAGSSTYTCTVALAMVLSMSEAASRA